MEYDLTASAGLGSIWLDIKTKEIIVMPKKSWYSATVILVIFAGCVVFGAENASDINETKADTPLISITPIEVNIPPIKVLPVKVNVQPIKLSSVKVQNPVKAEIQKPEAISVNV